MKPRRSNDLNAPRPQAETETAIGVPVPMAA